MGRPHHRRWRDKNQQPLTARVPGLPPNALNDFFIGTYHQYAVWAAAWAAKSLGLRVVCFRSFCSAPSFPAGILPIDFVSPLPHASWGRGVVGEGASLCSRRRLFGPQ